MGTYKSLSHLFGKRPEDEAKEKDNKKQWIAEQEDDEDEGGGGGHSKGLLGFYKKEKLHNLISEGKVKAKDYLGFLNKDRLDKSDFDKNAVAGDPDAKMSDMLEQQGVKQQAATDAKAETGKNKKGSWRASTTKSEAKAGVKAGVPLTFLDVSPGRNEIGSPTQASAEASARAVLGDKQLGTAFTGKEHGNSQGFTQQSWVGLDAGQISRRESQGKSSPQQQAQNKGSQPHAAEHKSIRPQKR